MRDVSAGFKESKANPEFVIKIVLSDSTELELTNKDIFEIEIKDAVSSDSTFDIGACLYRQLTLRLNNDNDVLSEYDFANAQVRLSVKKAVGNVVESVSLGRYIVDLPEFSGITITLNCLDWMVLFSKKIESVSGNTAGAVVNGMCMSLGISLATQRFNGCDMPLALPDVSDMTYIELLSYICQSTCNFGRINDLGQLEIKWYDTTVFDGIGHIDAGGFDKEQAEVVDGGDFTSYQTDNVYDAGSFEGNTYHHFYSNQSEAIFTDDVVITGVNVKNEDTEYLFGAEGYVLLIEDNPLTKGKEQEYAQRIGVRCVGMRFRPFSISTQSNMLVEAGDACIVTDRKGNSYYSYVTNTTYKVGSRQEISCGAESPVLNSADKFSLVTKAVIKARKETEQRITAYDVAVQQLTELMANSFGVFKTAEEQENGSVIYYMHNRPALKDSTTIWKMTADAFAVSTDGGKTWNAGFDSQGNAVVNILNAIGINADWINAGTLTGRAINNGNGTFSVNEDGNVVANALKSNNAEITGGSLNIDCDNGNSQKIRLAYVRQNGYSRTFITPMAFVTESESSNISMSPTGINMFKKDGTSIDTAITITDTMLELKNATYVHFPAALVSFYQGNCDTLFYKTLSQISDGRVKKNKRKISNAENSILDALIPCSYNFKKDYANDEKRHIGLYAQDFIDILNSLGNADNYSFITYNEESGLYGINYMELIPLMIDDRNRSKQQHAEYREQIERRITELEERLKRLEEREG